MRISGKKETEKNIKGRADKNTVYRALFSVLGALLVYEAGKMAGLLLAGALIGGGENAEEMLNSGLTGGLANLIMILTGGLACFALWKPFLHFRPAKQTDRKEILPFFIMAAALALGLNILMAFLQLDRFSETFREVSRAQADVPLWLGIVLYGLAAPFSEELVFRGIIMEKQEISSGLRRPWFFRPDIWNLSRESGAGYLCSVSGNRACMDDGTYGNPAGAHDIPWDREYNRVPSYQRGRPGRGAGKAVDLCGTSFYQCGMLPAAAKGR